MRKSVLTYTLKCAPEMHTRTLKLMLLCGALIHYAFCLWMFLYVCERVFERVFVRVCEVYVCVEVRIAKSLPKQKLMREHGKNFHTHS